MATHGLPLTGSSITPALTSERCTEPSGRVAPTTARKRASAARCRTTSMSIGTGSTSRRSVSPFPTLPRPCWRDEHDADAVMMLVERLTKTYAGGVEAVKGIDFTVAPGEIFGLLGPKGAGKSTTIGMLTTTVEPTGGTARLAGFDVVRQPLAARGVSAVVFQDSVLDRALTGRRNLEVHARLWGMGPAVTRARIAGLAGAFGLDGLLDRPVAGYSGGERRRLEIARALLSHPEVLFLDEPTVGLDPRIRHELLDLVAAMKGTSEVTVLLTTHYLDEAEWLCDRDAIVHAGRIVATGRPEALLARLGGGPPAGDGLDVRRLHRARPAPGVPQRPHAARGPRPPPHPDPVRRRHRPGAGQGHPGDPRDRLPELRRRRDHRPAGPTELHPRRHRHDRRPGERGPARPARRPRPAGPDGARQPVGGHRRQRPAGDRPHRRRRPAGGDVRLLGIGDRLGGRRHPRPRRGHARRRRDPGRPHPQAGGVRRRRPAGRPAAVVLRRLVLPDQRPARRPDGLRQGPAPDPRPGPAALRPGR